MPQLRSSDLAKLYGFTKRYWIKLAASGVIPGVCQISGPRGHWLFDAAEFARWWRGREHKPPIWTPPRSERLQAPSVIVERSAEQLKRDIDRLLMEAGIGSAKSKKRRCRTRVVVRKPK